MKITSILTTAVAALITVTATTMNVNAAGYIKFEGVEGEATDSTHKDWIIIESISSPLIRDTETGNIMQTLVVKRTTDKSSPALVQSFLDGIVFDEVKVATISPDNHTAVPAEPFKLMTLVGYRHTVGGAEDGMEEFTFQTVEREEMESAEVGDPAKATLLPTEQSPRQASSTDPDNDELPKLEPIIIFATEPSPSNNSKPEFKATSTVAPVSPMALILPAVQQVREAAR